MFEQKEVLLHCYKGCGWKGSLDEVPFIENEDDTLFGEPICPKCGSLLRDHEYDDDWGF